MPRSRAEVSEQLEAPPRRQSRNLICVFMGCKVSRTQSRKFSLWGNRILIASADRAKL